MFKGPNGSPGILIVILVCLISDWDTRPRPFPSDEYAQYCCPGDTGHLPACTAASLLDRKPHNTPENCSCTSKMHLNVFVCALPCRSSCISEWWSKATHSSRTLLTYSCCSTDVCFTALLLHHTWHTLRRTYTPVRTSLKQLILH